MTIFETNDSRFFVPAPATFCNPPRIRLNSPPPPAGSEGAAGAAGCSSRSRRFFLSPFLRFFEIGTCPAYPRRLVCADKQTQRPSRCIQVSVNRTGAS